MPEKNNSPDVKYHSSHMPDTMRCDCEFCQDYREWERKQIKEGKDDGWKRLARCFGDWGNDLKKGQ